MNIAESNITRVARWVADADALIIAAGAGMSVDSGLPDFRGSRGIWTTLLPGNLNKRDVLSFAQGTCFSVAPHEAWQFYGRALEICRSTVPHAGHEILLDWARSKRHGAFVYTSNVDGQFQAAGFAEERIVECHGSILHFQCAGPCCAQIWSAPATISKETPPRCPRCNGLGRPNCLLFSDSSWIVNRTNAQRLRLEVWRARPANAVVIEIGAALALPSVRMFAESLRLPLIRINTHDAYTDTPCSIALQGTALDVLRRMDSEPIARPAPACAS
jgi:NAD-dependent SIR2 family protein deacetylase